MRKLTVERILTIIIIAIMILSATVQVALAAEGGGIDMDPKSVTGQSSSASTSANTIVSSILGIVQVVAVAIAVIMLIVLGVKYVSAAPAEKADIKQSAMIYVVGAILMFGASGILGIIKTFATEKVQ